MINSLLIYHLIPELEKELVQSRISCVKITPDRKNLLLFAQKNSKEICLLLSIHPEYYRVELLTPKEAEKIESQSSPLSHQLNSAILTGLKQKGFDRVIEFCFVRKSQFQEIKEYRLVAELMGKNSNLILMEEATGKIVFSLRETGSSPNATRQIKTGTKYLPPNPPRKLNPLETSREEFEGFCLKNNEVILLHFLTGSFSSIDVLLATKIAHQAGIDVGRKISTLTPDEIGSLSGGFTSLFQGLAGLESNPQIVFDEQGFVTAISLCSLPFIPESRKQSCATVNQAIKVSFQTKQDQAIRGILCATLSKQLAKLEKKEAELTQDLEKTKDYNIFKKYGDLLVANIGSLKKGQNQVRLTDLFDPKQSEIVIPLEASLGPMGNARKYFKEFRKGETAIEIIETRLNLTLQEKHRLISLLDESKKNPSTDELAKIKTKWENMGYSIGVKKGARRKSEKPSSREFLSSDGFRILVGKSSKQNDYLSFKLASKDDLWFHADGFAGSHVLLLKDDKGRQFTRDAISQAASLAAYFSKARNSRKVSVIYTLAKNLRKPKGARSGLVTVSKEKGIMVVPRLPN